jgi:TPR repeat protein
LVASQGYTDAQYWIGQFFEKGQGGVTKDGEEVRRWLQLAASKGHKHVIRKLRNLAANK